MVTKSKVYQNFIWFKALARNQCGTKIKQFQTDNGHEFLCLGPLLQCIVHRRSYQYSHQSMGMVKRQHRHIIDTTFVHLDHSSLPTKFWDHGATTAVTGTQQRH